VCQDWQCPRFVENAIQTHQKWEVSLADHILSHPAEMKSAIEIAQKVHSQYGEIIRTASGMCEDGERLQSAVSEVQKTGEWFTDQRGENRQCVPSNNLFGRRFDSFGDLARWQ